MSVDIGPLEIGLLEIDPEPGPGDAFIGFSRRRGTAVLPGQVSVVPMLRSVNAQLYLAALREGGSLPGIVEADDLGTYVVKFVGAGQGRKTLVAEVVTGELARRLGFRVPELVTVEIDASMASCEPDEEVQDLLRASGGTNLGVDFLPRSIGFDPAVHSVAGGTVAGGSVEGGPADRVMWLDAFVGNVDRSWRNPNLLMWHGDVWLIDHGATLVFHHQWAGAASVVGKPVDLRDHVLAPFAGDLTRAHRELAPLVTEELLTEVVALVPQVWLDDEPGFDDAAAVRRAYVEHLSRRLARATDWLPASTAPLASKGSKGSTGSTGSTGSKEDAS